MTSRPVKLSAATVRTLCTWLAILGWSGLAIQLDLILLARWTSGASVLNEVGQLLRLFLSPAPGCCGVDLRNTRRESAGRRFFLQPKVRSGICVSIIVVGGAYSLLRNLWQPEGLQWLANELLHDVMPVLYALYWWWCVPKGALRIRHIGLWVLYPIVYFGYILLRGRALRSTRIRLSMSVQLGYALTIMNASGILAGFIAVAVIVVGLDRWK